MDQNRILSELVQGHEALVFLILSALILVLFITTLILFIKLGKLSKYGVHVTMKAGTTPVSEPEGLTGRLERAEETIVLLEERLKVISQESARSMQKVGLVRFDAFPDVGGEQSFALALLDRDLNGVVLSNLYSRSDSRVYAKEVAEGRSEHALSDEEQEALRRAGTA
ncbi:MAG: DUF4446 family protein [Armatimonadetes bacterium]|nr:DUF4446 family protein [Armatimonadota bacterium]